VESVAEACWQKTAEEKAIEAVKPAIVKILRIAYNLIEFPCGVDVNLTESARR